MAIDELYLMLWQICIHICGPDGHCNLSVSERRLSRSDVETRRFSCFAHRINLNVQMISRCHILYSRELASMYIIKRYRMLYPQKLIPSYEARSEHTNKQTNCKAGARSAREMIDKPEARQASRPAMTFGPWGSDSYASKPISIKRILLSGTRIRLKSENNWNRLTEHWECSPLQAATRYLNLYVIQTFFNLQRTWTWLGI